VVLPIAVCLVGVRIKAIAELTLLLLIDAVPTWISNAAACSKATPTTHRVDGCERGGKGALPAVRAGTCAESRLFERAG
jgi:hypothetical protein